VTKYILTYAIEHFQNTVTWCDKTVRIKLTNRKYLRILTQIP
jgi:hypothetical protein